MVQAVGCIRVQSDRVIYAMTNHLHDLARMNIIQQINRAGTSDVD
jgi:hypothetical protein